MKSLFALSFSLLTTLFSVAENDENYTTYPDVKCTKIDVESCLFSNLEIEANNPALNIEDIVVYDLEEEVSIDFEPQHYLPENFDPLVGINRIDWNSASLYEVEEEVDLGFDSKEFLPRDFNSYEAIEDIDWSTIELVEIEEEVDLTFNTANYLPTNFDVSESI